MRWYNNDKDYENAYHWHLLPYGIITGGLEYFQYANFVVELAKKIEPRSILDIGCGDGKISDMLAQSTGAYLLGIDVSRTAIMLARNFSKHADFECISLENLAHKSRTFDLITMIEVLEHIDLETADKWMNILPGVVGKNGKIIISTPTVNYPMTHKGHQRHFTKEMIQNLCRDKKLRTQSYYWLYNMKGCFRHGRYRWLRNFIRLIDNKYWNVKPITKIIAAIHTRKYKFSPETSAGRVVAVLEPV